MQPVRRLMDACRAINEIVFALLFVVAVGLGPFAGVMAIFVHNTRRVLQALFRGGRGDRSASGGRHPRDRRAAAFPRSSSACIPQVVPLWSSFILYRLETNVRSATTLGIVGAGGIGQTLYESIRSFHYAETAAQMLIVVRHRDGDRPDQRATAQDALV